MKNPEILTFLMLVGLFFSCSDNTGKSNVETTIDKTVIETVKYEDKNVLEKAPGCNLTAEQCAAVRISFPEVTATPGGLDKDLLNQQIQQAILKGSLDPEGAAGDVKNACKKFIEDFIDFKKEVPQDIVPWSIEIKVEVINNDPDYFSLRVDEDAYLGGAHPNQFTNFMNYDVKSGKKVTLDDLFNDTSRLMELAEQKFREAKNLSSTANLNEAGYFFEEGKFTLTENFGISQGKLLLFYNSYDIAPYALGPTLLELPMETIL